MNLSASTVCFGVDDNVAMLVLLGSTERPQQRAQRHVGIEFLRKSDAARVAELRFYFLCAIVELVPGVRTICISDLRPKILAIVPGIGHVTIGKRKMLLARSD